MTVTEALEKLKTYEQTSFALGHAMGLLYYDGVTVAPKGAAAVRGDEKPYVTFEGMRRDMKIVDLAFESSRRNEVIKTEV